MESKLDAETLVRARESATKQTGTPPSSTPPETTPPCLARNIPPHRTDNTFESFSLKRAPKMRQAYDYCRQVAAGDRWIAFLAGGTGNGKTHLACAAANKRLSFFWKVPDFLAWLRPHLFGEDGGGGAQIERILEGYRSPDFLLVLDDYGAHNRTEWAEDVLYRLLDWRYEQRAPTILTCNVPLDSVDQRVLSRFREGLIVCDSKDQRAAKEA